MTLKTHRIICGLLAMVLLGLFFSGPGFCEFSFLQPEKSEQPEGPQPIVVNGDTVEYSADSKEFSATGNVLVIYKGTKLSCQKLTLNSATKECEASGNTRLDDGMGIIEGSKLVYNFQTKAGTIFDANFRANPYFGKAEELKKVNDEEFLTTHGSMTTCSFDHPHWQMKARKVDFFPGDKVQLKDSVVYVGDVPLMYLPQYTRSFKEPMMKVQVMPGTKKDWGPFLLTAWRYDLTEDIKGRIYLDYRSNFGVGEGFGTNYDSPDFGKGDFKFYYTQERDKSKDVDQEDVNAPKVFERYLARLRHKWDIDPSTNFIAEYYKIVDSKRALLGTTFNFLKDYFPREYDLDPQPLTYVQFHRSSQYINIDLLVQKRVNTWYTQTEQLPQATFTLPSMLIGRSPFYIANTTSYQNTYQKTAAPADNNDSPSRQFSTSNTFTVPLKASIILFSPYVTSTQTYNDHGTYGSTITNTFSGGTGASTKFYRVFNVKTNFLGLDINDLRHIITPSVNYAYTNSTDSKFNEMNIGGQDSTRTSVASLELENKLQTKRNGKKVDIFDLLIDTDYNFRSSGSKGQLSDFTTKLSFAPYSWLSLYSESVYKYKEGYFNTVNYDLSLNFGEERNLGFGQRYQYKGNNELTYQLKWRLNPKWMFSYHRINRGSDAIAKTGLREQEYQITRDLHCWSVNLNYNTTKGKGDALWLVFRLKAFPEMEFEFNKSYHAPKAGSQSEPNM